MTNKREVKSEKNLSQWLQHLSNLPSGLTNVTPQKARLIARKNFLKTSQIADTLDLVNFDIPVITVAGTNGKGSTVIFLESILVAAGYRVGAYLSPHLLRFNERVRINGKEVSDAALTAAFAKIAALTESKSLTYFSFITLTALTIFKTHALDVLILEVGLGGRFDAVNVVNTASVGWVKRLCRLGQERAVGWVKSERQRARTQHSSSDPTIECGSNIQQRYNPKCEGSIAVLTNVALDHLAELGKTRALIGKEKVGIMRQGALFVCGDADPPAAVLVEAKKMGVQSYFINQDFFYRVDGANWFWWQKGEKVQQLPLPSLQVQDAALSLMVLEIMQQRYGFKISLVALKNGLQRAFLPGRFEKRTVDGKEVVFDVAHNPAAVALLAENLKRAPVAGKTLAVFSMLKDKDILASLQSVAPLVDVWYIAAIKNDRAASSAELKKALQQSCAKKIVVCKNVTQAMQRAIADCHEKDRIVAFGSFYLLAEILQNFYGDKQHGNELR